MALGRSHDKLNLFFGAILMGVLVNFNQNLEEIKNIFTTIHSPKEFTDIKYKDKTDILKFK